MFLLLRLYHRCFLLSVPRSLISLSVAVDGADWFNFWSHYDLIDQEPSGLWMNNMAYSFEQCYPKSNSSNTTLFHRHFGFTLLLSGAANFVVNSMMLCFKELKRLAELLDVYSTITPKSCCFGCCSCCQVFKRL